jgi:hypothetical protein
MRYLLAVAYCISFAATFIPGAAHGQAGFDRPGGDYANFVVKSGDPGLCAARCERDGRCRAWSFSYPSAAGSRAVCWLKNQVTPRVEKPCCISGVKGAGVAEAQRGPLEFSIDRVGGDYKNFEIPSDPTGKSCAAACEADNRCRAWTYLRPGYGSTAARCYLKERVTPPHRRPCCLSGVVR